MRLRRGSCGSATRSTRSRNFRCTTFVLPNDVLALALDGEKVAA
jgi:hypothetical protein